MTQDSQLPYGFTDDHFKAPDENGNRFFNDDGQKHAQENLPTQPALTSQIANINFGSQPLPSIEPGLSPMLQQGMDTSHNAQPISIGSVLGIIGAL